MLPSCSAASRIWKHLLYYTWEMEQNRICSAFLSSQIAQSFFHQKQTHKCVCCKHTAMCVTQTLRQTNKSMFPSSPFNALPENYLVSCWFRSYCKKRPGAHLTAHPSHTETTLASQLCSCVQPHSLHSLQPLAAVSGACWNQLSFQNPGKRE